MKIIHFQKLKFLNMGTNPFSCSRKCHWVSTDHALSHIIIVHPACSKEESRKRGRCKELAMDFMAGIQVGFLCYFGIL